MAKMTLWGIEHFLNSLNQSVFDNLVLPDGMTKETLTDNILLNGGEFSVVYSDAEFLKEAIGKWSTKNADTFAKWFEVWNKEYNPLYNFDRMEITSDSENEIHKNLGMKIATDSSNKTLGNVTKVNGSNENKVSAFDANDYQPKDKSISESDNLARGTENTLSRNKNADDESRINTRGVRHKGHLFGNIGVTQTTELLTNENEFRKNYNPYQLITDLFVVDFLIPIY